MIFLETIQKVLLTLFFLKIMWNILLPYFLVWKLIKTKEKQTDSVSVMPFLDVFLGCLTIVISLILPSFEWYQNTNILLIIVAGSIIGSIIHFIVIGFLGGALASSLENR